MTNYGVYPPNSGREVRAQLKVLIADITLTNTGSFEMIPIPAGYDHLEIVAVVRGTVAATSDSFWLLLNGDTTAANYSVQSTVGTGATNSTARSDTPTIFSAPAASSTADDYGSCIGQLTDIVLPGKRRSGIFMSSERRDATTQLTRQIAYNWESTEPVTNITIRTDNHPTDLATAGSRVQVFGIGTFSVALAR